MNKYNMACTEILEILKYLSNEDYEKIPKDEINFFEQNKDTDYSFKFNENLSFEEQAILPETKAIIVKLYKDYFCTNEHKLALDRLLQINNEINKNKQDSETVDNIFDTKSQKNEIMSTDHNKGNALQIRKRKWYEIIFNIFRKQN